MTRQAESEELLKKNNGAKWRTPSVIGKFSFIGNVVDDRERWKSESSDDSKSTTQHRSLSNYCRNLHSPKGINQLLNSGIKILTQKRKKVKKTS